jgi:hypothetical protein
MPVTCAVTTRRSARSRTFSQWPHATSSMRVTALSLDRRFATGYACALQLATIVLAASGFRVAAQRGHHVVTWLVLPELMGVGMTETGVYFDSCRTLRNRSDYDRAGVVSAAEVDEVLREAEDFRGRVLEWLAQEHPRLAPGPE